MEYGELSRRRRPGVNALRDRRDAAIRAYHRRGYTPALIARLVGLSHPGVTKAMARMERDGDVPPGWWRR